MSTQTHPQTHLQTSLQASSPTGTALPALQGRDLVWGATRGGAPIVRGVSLTVRAGATVGLIGPNGSGKSSLMRLLAGVTQPQSGEVLLGGQPMQRLTRRQIAHQLALVSQMADTQDAITVQDAVELGRTPWLSALQTWSARDDAIVEQALADVGMAEKKGRVWNTLSGGERQRVHIARALAQQTSVLLLDEPGNHLDIHHQLALGQLIHRLPGTKVMAIHDLNQARHCDWLAVMQQGRLVCEGAPDDVLQADLLEKVFEVRLRVLTDPEDGACVLRFLPL